MLAALLTSITLFPKPGFDASFTPLTLPFDSVMSNASAVGLLIRTVRQDGLIVVNGLPVGEEAGAAALYALSRRLVPKGGTTATTDFFLDTNAKSQATSGVTRTPRSAFPLSRCISALALGLCHLAPAVPRIRFSARLPQQAASSRCLRTITPTI